jgi:hypothetical protein
MQLRSLLAVGLAATVTAAGLAATTPTAGADEPVPLPDSALALTAPDTVVAYSYRGRVYSDLGLRLVAGQGPVEVWSNRASYDDPITSVWRRSEEEGGDVPLPAGSMKDFGGLKKFTHLTITSVATGEVVKARNVPGCLNGDSQRIHPDAPARSPYPWSCPWNPYTVGSVMGIQEGWSNSVFPEWTRFRLDRGRYDVTASIAPEYVEVFGISEEDASVTTRLVVKKESFEERPSRPAAAGVDPKPAPRPSTSGAGVMAVDGAPCVRHPAQPARHRDPVRRHRLERRLRPARRGRLPDRRR